MMVVRRLFLTCLLYLAGGVSSSSQERPSHIAALQETLLTGYDKFARPVTDPNNVTSVRFGFSLNNLNLDDETQTMHINTWLILIWQDEFLKWRPEDFGNLTRVHLAPEDIWTPDITLYNSKNSESFFEYGNTPLIVKDTGEVVWFPPFVGEVPCVISMSNWPSDLHKCKFHFGSWAHHGKMIDIQLLMGNETAGILLDNYESNTKWKLVNLSSTRQVESFGEGHVLITMEVTVQRMMTKYASYFINSGFAIMLVIMLSYGLPLHFHMIRIVFHVFALTLLTISLISFILFLPPLGSRPFIVNYYTASILLGTFSLTFAILMCNDWILFPIFNSQLLRNISKSIVRTVSSFPLLNRIVKPKVSYEGLDSQLLTESETIEKPDKNHDMIIVLRILNFVAGFTFAISFMIIHFTMKSNIM